MTGHDKCEEFRQLVLKDLKARFSSMSTIGELAVVLDPQTRHGRGPNCEEPYLSRKQISSCWQRLGAEVLNHKFGDVASHPIPSIPGTNIWSSVESPTKKPKSSERLPPQQEQLQRELQMYMYCATPMTPEQHSLEWWQFNCLSYPHIFLLAMKYLAIPATSAESERLFSLAKLFMTLHQTGKLPQLMSDQVFLNRNMDLLDEDQLE